VDEWIYPPADEKWTLRELMRAVRERIPASDRAHMARAAEERLLSEPAVKAARMLLVFWSFGHEIDTHGVIGRLQAEGRGVLLPFIDGGRMEAAAFRGDDQLAPSRYGSMAPADPVVVDPTEIDVALAPGLAFDRRGFRLGYGGGHFDGFLPRLRPGALRVGYCFHVQMVDHVPNGPGDEPVDLVITDQETFTCGSR
jgi:5-formyltetrahydrofolate cyclo-ligase